MRAQLMYKLHAKTYNGGAIIDRFSLSYREEMQLYIVEIEHIRGL